MAIHGALETPAKREKIIELVLAGKSDAEIALALSGRRLKVSRQAINGFRKRHADVLKPAEAELIEQVKQRWIADKDARLGELEYWYDLTRKEADEFGITVVERVTETKGEGDEASEVVTETRDYRAALVKEARGILRQASEELGQLPKAGDVNINAGNGSKVLVITPEQALGFSKT